MWHRPRTALNWFKRLCTWLCAVIVHFGKLRIGGLAVFGLTNLMAVFVTVATFLLVRSYPSSCLESAIRLTGMVLQLFGVITVAIKLRAAQGQFHLPTTRHSVRHWLERFPRFRAQHHILAASAVEAADSFASARARVSAGPTTPLDRRVALLEENYASLFDEVGNLTQEMNKSAREFSEALRTERAERENADKGHKEQLKEAIVGRVHLDFAGVFYLLVGIIAATASSEFARWIGAAPCS